MTAIDTNISQQISSSAREILALARKSLNIYLRYMVRATEMLKLAEIPGIEGTMTDGTYLYYDPAYVAGAFVKNQGLPTRSYLHSVLHCLYSHWWVSGSRNQEYWDLACDIVVDTIIDDLGIPTLESSDLFGSTNQWSKQWRIKHIKYYVKYFTADCIYDYFLRSPLKESELEEYQSLFAADRHDVWYSLNLLNKLRGQATSQQQSTGPSDRSYIEVSDALSYENEIDDSNNEQLLAMNEMNQIQEQTHKTWNETARSIKINMETFLKSHGNTAGCMLQNLQAVTREKYNYTDFLKKFSVMGEKLQINQDEFDYIPYVYGLKTYENMPLIEPLEYKDVKLVKELVIAIDTSGSTSGNLVQMFLQKTYNILKTTANFADRFVLHIIQCDTEIQEDARIITQDQFDDYIKTMQIKGHGGTDFRPVFTYVDEMISRKEFKNLKGLIYFTDGYGTFPKHPPKYETAFVFIDDGYESPDVPPWAIRQILSTEDIETT